MDILVNKDTYNRLQEESYLYHTTIAPVEARYEAIVNIQYGVILILLVLLGVAIGGYFYERSLKKYYKAVIDINFKNKK